MTIHCTEFFQDVGFGDVHASKVAGHVDETGPLGTLDLAVGHLSLIVSLLRPSQLGNLGLDQAGFPEDAGLFDATNHLVPVHGWRVEKQYLLPHRETRRECAGTI